MEAEKSRMSPLQTGYTLVELLIVISVLALIAAVTAPAFTVDNEMHLQRATAEVVRALRFAQSEAIRSGKPYGVIANTGDQSIKVYRLDNSVNPPVVYYDVRDPLTKQLYDIRFGSSDIKITDIFFKFDSVASPLDFVGFAGDTGVPKYNDSGTVRMLEDGYIDLSYDSHSGRIRVAPVTGRVTIQ